MKGLAARSALFGALFLLAGCSVRIAREPSSDAPTPLAESTPPPSTPAPASPQNTAPPTDAASPTDALTLEKPKSECNGLSEKPCGNKKVAAERASMTAHNVEAGRKAAAERKAVEQRRAAEQRKKAAALQRLTEERKAQEARLAEAARIANEADEKRLADKFKRAFERGRSNWLNAQ